MPKEKFDAEHKRLFTFALPLEHELVSLRAIVQGKGIVVRRPVIPRGAANPRAAAVGQQAVYIEGKDRTAIVYDRARLKAGNRIEGPAIIIEMDSTTVILPRHHGRVDRYGNILIYPERCTRRAGDGAGPKQRSGQRPGSAVRTAAPGGNARRRLSR